MEDINYHTCLVIYIVGVLKFTPQSRCIVTVYSIAGSRGESKGGGAHPVRASPKIGKKYDLLA